MCGTSVAQQQSEEQLAKCGELRGGVLIACSELSLNCLVLGTQT